MVTLFCALVGAKGSAFPVDIDASEAVDDLKKAIKSNKPRTIACDASELGLFLAKKGDGTWLTSDGVDAVTLGEHGNPQGFDKMDATLWIKNDRYFGENFVPNEGEIHVLVVVPSDEVEAKRRRMTGAFQGVVETPLPTERVDRMLLSAVYNANYVTVPAALLDKCGLLAPEADKVMLYRRREVQDLWNFVEEEDIAQNASVCVVGPPGTGKSLSTLCYVAQLDSNQWNAVWIHFGAWMNSCLSMGTCEYWKHINLSTFVVPRVVGKRLLVCLDGYKADPTHRQYVGRIRRGLTEDDRLLVCSSMMMMKK